MPAGRPRTIFIDSAACAKIVKIMSQGKGLAAVGKAIGCTPERLGQLAKENEELFRALEEGKHLSLLWWEEMGRKNLKDKRLNTGLYTFMMSNKFGWHQRQKIEAETKQETTVKLDNSVLDSVIDKILESNG